MKTVLIATAAILVLSACAQTNNGRENFNRPAGSSIDNGNFGAATMNNLGVQSGQIDYAINLGHRFASEVNATITFPFNSTALDETARATLRRQATWIKQFPEVRFKVFGHTDLVGSQSYNRRLGLRRAQAAVLYLTSQGISRSRLEAVSSFGESQPVIVTQEMERRNRRTVTEVSGFVTNHPTVLNGKYAEVIFREYIASAVPLSGTAAADGQ
ncbi:MAG: peptidoglycan-associated lipoprotein [Gammaproteobacteria bacterium]|jgi:peptidoglycan-associated lipoprotein